MSLIGDIVNYVMLGGWMDWTRRNFQYRPLDGPLKQTSTALPSSSGSWVLSALSLVLLAGC